jgi:hypothetical protein
MARPMILFSRGQWMIVSGRRVVGRYPSLRSAREALFWKSLPLEEGRVICALPPSLPPGPRLVKTEDPEA